MFTEVDVLGTVIHVAVNKSYAGYIRIADKLKEDAVSTIIDLKSVGVKRIAILTGDNKIIAIDIGAKLNIGEIYSELLPNEKVEKIEMIEKQKNGNRNIIFVGDGINDAPVLARADIGIAMGGLGYDAAIEAADIVIMNDEPSKIVTVIKIAKRTKKIVWQNIIFSLGIKTIILILGAAGIATMWAAVFADVGVSIIAVLNSLRVLNTNKI